MSKNNFDLIQLEGFSFRVGRSEAQINSIIVHCFGFGLADILSIFKKLGVSAHYIIPYLTSAEIFQTMPHIFNNHHVEYPDQAPVFQLVSNENTAYHAGMSFFGDLNNQPNCAENLNPCSIGIEFESPGYGDEDRDLYRFSDYSKTQRDVGIKLIEYLIQKNNIPKQNIFGHSTIAVGRKTDPGPNFFWNELFKFGLGFLPEPTATQEFFFDDPVDILLLQKTLYAIGFIKCPQTGILDPDTILHVEAFIMQYCSHLWQGKEKSVTNELLSYLLGFNRNKTN
jgi:N-acetyl-anhydromuramyl-L-alanine amidase AmpD